MAKTCTQIRNVRVINGRENVLTEPQDVLIEGNLISRIAPAGKELPSLEAKVIDGTGHIMTPGFIEGHSHLMFQMPIFEGLFADEYHIALTSVEQVRSVLMQGFTTVRDLAGNTFSLKRAIDRGMLPGPRIYPSGAMISQTSGHADQRPRNAPMKMTCSCMSLLTPMGGHMVIADGVDEVLGAVREQLRQGASQIKIAVGGGTGSQHDPLDVVEFTASEIQAAVDAAGDWNTYVSAHVYNPRGILRAVKAGVRSIEHGNLVDQAALEAMAENNVWLSPQVLTYTVYPPGYTPDQKLKHDEAFAAIDRMFKLTQKIGFKKIAFGTDVICDPKMMANLGQEFVLRSQWFEPAEILRQATSQNAELLAMSGPRNPYPGALGVIEEGALADLLVMRGNPLSDLSILTRPTENLAVIMKDGQLFKNELTARPA